MADGQVTASEHWRKELDNMVPEWGALFPSPQALMRFRRVVATAIAGNPDLLGADRRSLWQACTQAAQDELMPDGREGALVIYNVKVTIKSEDDEGRSVARDEWRRVARWMPMVAGVLKRIRKSGELLDISVQAVHEQDQFKYQLGDDAKIVHVPNIEADDRGELRFVYAIARTKDGGVYREVMSRKQIDEVRASSKTGQKGPWKDWYEEMARKSVIRRIAKFLPMGAEVEAIFKREEDDKAITVEAVPVIAGPRINSRQAKLNGDWGKLTGEMDELASLDAIDDWESRNEGRILGYSEAWQEQIREYLDKRREVFWSAMASHKGDDDASASK